MSRVILQFLYIVMNQLGVFSPVPKSKMDFKFPNSFGSVFSIFDLGIDFHFKMQSIPCFKQEYIFWE